jgi:hypothetical protein
MTFIKPGNRIYYYCRLSTAIEKILPNKELLLNFIKNTNDPREYKDFVFAARYFPTDTINFDENSKRVSHLLRNDCKVLCFSSDYKHFWGHSYSRMWSHYGDNHEGLCLELDKSEFIEENKDKIASKMFRNIKYYEFDIKKQIKHKPIDYTQIKNGNLDHYIKSKFRNKYSVHIYFTKNKEWESEREIRLIYFSNNLENEYCTIKRSLKNIHLGVKFNDGYLPSIIKLAPDTEIFRMDYRDVGLRSIPIK